MIHVHGEKDRTHRLYWHNTFGYINIYWSTIKRQPGGYSIIHALVQKKDTIEPKKEYQSIFHFAGFSSFEIVP